MNVRSRTQRPQISLPPLAQRLRFAVEQHWHAASDDSLVIVRLLGDATTKHENVLRPLAAPEELFQALASHIRTVIRHTDDLIVVDEGIAIVLHTSGPDGARCVFQRIVEAVTVLGQHEQMPLPSAGRRSSRHTRHTNTDGPPSLTLGIGYAPGGESEQARLPHPAENRPRSHRKTGGLPEHTDKQDMDALFTQACEPHIQLALSPTACMRFIHFARTFPLPISSATSSNMPLAPTSGRERDAETTEAQVSATLRRRAEAVGAPFIHLPARLTLVCQRAIPYELASELRAIPIGRTRTTLTVAMEHPQDGQALRRLRLATGLSIFPVLGAPDEIERALALLKTE